MRIPQTPAWMRWLVIACGLVTLFWLSLEDHAVWPVVVLGLTITSVAYSIRVLQTIGGRSLPIGQWVLGMGLSGGIIGVGTSLVTTLLMFFKTAWHSHLFPDYPPGLMLAILERAPVWALAGVIIGAGLAMLALAIQPQSNHDTQPTSS